MAFNEKQILTCFLFIWFSFIKVRGFVVFNEEKSLDSAGSFNKNARTRESFDQGHETPKSGAQAGRLLIWQDQASKAHGSGGGSVSFFSDLNSHSQADDNAYQSDDSGWMKMQPLWGQVYGLNTMHSPAVERLLGMRPKVDCVGDLMKLTVHGPEAPFGSNFLIDRGSIPPLPLSQLPSECGHRFLKTWRDFVFVIPYDGCYVMHERDTFVLPLLWWGLPVKVSCSSLTSVKSAPTVSCYTNGMIVRLHRGVSENLKIKVMNEWQPLLKVSARCGYSLVSHPEGLVIHAPYMPCTEPKDGMFTLSLAMESEFNLSCPALSLSLPISTPARENGALTSIPHALASTTLIPTTTTTTTAAAAATTTTKTTQPIPTPTTSPTTSTSSVQKLPTPPLPYYILGQPDFKPVPPSYPFVLFPPNIPPTIVPQGPKIVSITQRPQASVYTKRPQTWYPKPGFGLIPDPGQSAAVLYPGKPLLPPAEAPTAPPISPLLKPTSIPKRNLTTTAPIVPPVQWAPMFPPSNLVYSLGLGKPGLAAPSSAGFPQIPYWVHHSQTQPRPPELYAPPKPKPDPPTPAPTRKTGPQLLRYPWYKPFPPPRSEMTPVPTKVPQSTTVSTSATVASSSTRHSEKSEQAVKPQASKLPYSPVIKGPPTKLYFDFPPITSPTPSLPKRPEVVHPPAQIKAPLIPISSSHAHSFHCPTFCPGPPSIFYHQHNHHHFGHPLQISSLNVPTMTKITGQMLSSPVLSPISSALFPLIQGVGYNYAQLYSKDTVVQPSSDRSAMQHLVENPLIKDSDAPETSKHLAEPTMCPYFFRKLESTASPQPNTKPDNVAPVVPPSKLNSRPLQNRPVAEPLAYSDQSLDPAINQAKMQQYFSPWGHDMQSMVVAPNNVPSFEKLVQHDITSKPTIPPTLGKNAFMNYWYQAANLNAKPPMSDSPTQDSFTQMPSTNHNPFEPINESPQPAQTRGKNPPLQLSFHPLMQIRNSVPVMNPQLYVPPNGESVVPVFRDPKLFDTHWVPAFQSNKDALLSSSQSNGYIRRPSTVD